MLLTAKKTILFSGTMSYKTEVMMDKASKSASKFLNLDVANRRNLKLDKLCIYEKGKRDQVFLKEAKRMSKKGSLIIVSNGKEDWKTLLTE